MLKFRPRLYLHANDEIFLFEQRQSLRSIDVYLDKIPGLIFLILEIIHQHLCALFRQGQTS